ncbi:PREDICTED: oleosin 14.9 kDa [Tarenaya hassleriana]|uniref:oleosin 14.9 kDa n=1 Tax=Tarenaya hassleriana TaxID=28532 RepID=UPI0008FD0953|nr:PREDICTED: oleosin 14.9 kDa [Tarenaya hassleriana]
MATCYDPSFMQKLTQARVTLLYSPNRPLHTRHVDTDAVIARHVSSLLLLIYVHIIILFLLGEIKIPKISQKMADQPATRKLYDSAPSARQTVRFLTATTIGLSLLVLSGLTLTGTVIALVLATPLMVIFSPVLIPAVITMVVLAAGFLFSGGCGVAAATALSWIYRYVTGKHPIGADKIDYARMRIAEKAKEYGHYVQQKTHEATGTTQ